jgi:hypothetical protein
MNDTNLAITAAILARALVSKRVINPNTKNGDPDNVAEIYFRVFDALKAASPQHPQHLPV